MRLLKKMISALLVVCMVISMVPMAAMATETESVQPVEGRVLMDAAVLNGQTSVWIDGVEYAVLSSGASCYVDLPAGTDPSSMVTYSYHIGNAADVHTQYPIGMQVWALKKNADGSFTPEKIEELENILQYSGSSIRITGNKGIRMITSIEKSKKKALTSSDGLGGYKLLEYGTVVAWSSDLADGSPLVLGSDYAKFNYAYKKGEADPVFKYDGDLMQYTNVLVGFTLDECANDIAMRSYMILEDENGEQMTIYGGAVQRSIGYIAWQNRDEFKPGSAAHKYVWEIIRHVYAEVTFEANGGSEIENVFVQKGGILEQPADPVREGYRFTGWYTDKELNNSFNFSDPVNEAVTLYAGWEDGSEKLHTVHFVLVLGKIINSDSIQNVQVKDGRTVTMPEVPVSNYAVFDNWYTGLDYQTVFDFSAPIEKDTYIYAKWEMDTTDTDGEGIYDVIEKDIGTDPEEADTDGDGLTDYIEMLIETNPLVVDTDANGISDYDEDADNDLLINGFEVENGTSLIYSDTDFDGLTDYEELNVHSTDPLEEDTDGDGATDFWEINNGFDPCVANSSFTVTATTEEVTEYNLTSASVELGVSGEQVGTVKVKKIDYSDNPLVRPSIPGYMGAAYDFSVDGNFTEATITFAYNTDVFGEQNEDFQPRIYYLNEEKGLYEELPNQTVSEGYVSVPVSHFSTYILLNKVEFEEVWKNEIKAPGTEDSVAKNLKIAFVIDVSGSMSGTKISTVKTVMSTFIDNLGDVDEAAIVKFASSASVVQSLTTDKDLLRSAISSLRASGGTSISKGVALGIEQLVPNAVNGTSFINIEDADLCYYGEGEAPAEDAATEAVAFTTEKNSEEAGAPVVSEDAVNHETLSEVAGSYDVIILLTDGQDSSFNSYWSHYAQICVENQITAYSIGIGSGVSSSHLTSFAEATGGKYYHASIADELNKYFEDIKGETVDYTTDSNHDGISDYYTKLIFDGKIPMADHLSGIDFSGSADYDGDGLKNGEELQITTCGDRVYVKMVSDPTLKHSDRDGIDDYTETRNGTNPLKYNVRKDAADVLTDDDYYYSALAYEYYEQGFQDFIVDANALIHGVWNKDELYRDAMINYFSKYAKESYLEDIAFEATRTTMLDTLAVIREFFSGIKDSVPQYYEYYDKVLDLIDMINGTTNKAELYLLIEKYEVIIEEIIVLFPDNTVVVHSRAVAKAKVTVVNVSKTADVVCNGLTVAVALIDLADTVASFSAVTANNLAFEQNLDIIQHIIDHSTDKNAVNAAKDIRSRLQGEYIEAVKACVADALENAIPAIAEQIMMKNPYTAAIVLVRTGLDLITGISEDLRQLFTMCSYVEMARAAAKLFKNDVYTKGSYYEAYANNDDAAETLCRYLTHVAQIRILSEKEYCDYQEYGGVLGWFIDNSDVEQKVDQVIGYVLWASDLLGLNINPALTKD